VPPHTPGCHLLRSRYSSRCEMRGSADGSSVRMCPVKGRAESSRSLPASVGVNASITEGFGWKGPQRSSSPNPPAMGRDTFHWTRFLKALSNLALNTSRDGASTASLGSLFQHVTTLTGKNFFPRSNPNLPSFSLKPLPLVLLLQVLVKSPSPAFL